MTGKLRICGDPPSLLPSKVYLTVQVMKQKNGSAVLSACADNSCSIFTLLFTTLGSIPGCGTGIFLFHHRSLEFLHGLVLTQLRKGMSEFT